MKKILLIIILALSFASFSQDTIKVVGPGSSKIQKPISGYGTDTALVYMIKNSNTDGIAGFISISGTDTSYFVTNGDGNAQLSSTGDLIINPVGKIEFLSRTRQTFTDLDVTASDTLNYRNFSLNIDNELLATTNFRNEIHNTTINNNSGINAGKLSFRGNEYTINNYNDSLISIIANKFSTNNKKGHVNAMYGLYNFLSCNTSGTDSAHSSFIYSINNLALINSGTSTSASYIETLNHNKNSINIFAAGNTELDNVIGGETNIQIKSASTGTLRADDITLNYIHLYDNANVSGVIDIDNIKGLYIENTDNRQGSVSTYGIYEDFGDNYFANKITTADSVEIAKSLVVTGNVTIGKELVLTGFASAPTTPAEGTLYYNTADKHFYGWNGTGWVQLDN